MIACVEHGLCTEHPPLGSCARSQFPSHANSDTCMRSVIRSRPCCARQTGSCFVWFSATVQRRRLCLCDYCGKRLMRHGNTYIDGTSLGGGRGAHAAFQDDFVSSLPDYAQSPNQEFFSFFFFFCQSRAELDLRSSLILFCQMCTFFLFFFQCQTP